MKWELFSQGTDILRYSRNMAQNLGDAQLALFLAACGRMTAVAKGPFFCGTTKGGNIWSDWIPGNRKALRKKVKEVFETDIVLPLTPLEKIQCYAFSEKGRPALYHFDHAEIWSALVVLSRPKDASPGSRVVKPGDVWWEGDTEGWKRELIDELVRSGRSRNTSDTSLNEAIVGVLDELYAEIAKGVSSIPIADNYWDLLFSYLLTRYDPTKTRVDFLSYDLLWAKIKRLLQIRKCRPLPSTSGANKALSFYRQAERCWKGIAKRGEDQEQFIRLYLHTIGMEGKVPDLYELFDMGINGIGKKQES